MSFWRKIKEDALVKQVAENNKLKATLRVCMKTIKQNEELILDIIELNKDLLEQNKSLSKENEDLMIYIGRLKKDDSYVH